MDEWRNYTLHMYDKLHVHVRMMMMIKMSMNVGMTREQNQSIHIIAKVQPCR